MRKNSNNAKAQKAKIADVMHIHELINLYAKKEIMLHKSLSEIYEDLRDYYVIRNKKDNGVIGCGALHICWGDLAEIKSLAIRSRFQRKGYGKKIVSALLFEARKLGIHKIFALTTSPKFFQKLNFKKTNKKNMPSKIWGECIKCSRFPDNCNETALVYELK